MSFFLTYSSVLNYLSGLSHYLKSRGKQGVDFANFFVRSSLNGARRMCHKGRGKAPGIFPDDLLNIFKELDFSSINDFVFWSAVTLAFRCLLRASNYCKSVHCLIVRDVLFVKDGIVLRIVSFYGLRGCCEQLFKLYKGGKWVPLTSRWFNLK